MAKVHWVTDYSGAIGNSLGYATHNDRMKSALAATGVEFDESAPVAIHVCPPHHFRPLGKRSIVSCAWEYPELPDKFRILEQAAFVMPTATFLIEPFRKMLPGVRVEHLPLGVDCDRFAYVKRSRHFSADRPMRFLYNNAPNARKNPVHVVNAWEPFANNKRVELYCKTTVSPGSGVEVGVRKYGNVIFDTRKLPIEEMVALYRSSDCMINPSSGEGFGLTAAEALATGMAFIYTAGHAFLDLAPPHMNLGYPLRWRPNRQWLGPIDSKPGDTEYDEDDHFDTLRMWVTGCNPSVDEIAEKIAEVITNTREAFDRGRRASDRIRRRFTWQSAGQRLRKIVDELYAEIESGTPKDSKRVEPVAA